MLKEKKEKKNRAKNSTKKAYIYIYIYAHAYIYIYFFLCRPIFYVEAYFKATFLNFSLKQKFLFENKERF